MIEDKSALYFMLMLFVVGIVYVLHIFHEARKS